MKYVKPTIELSQIESEDIITASAQYEVEENEDDGNVIFDASNIFSKFRKN